MVSEVSGKAENHAKEKHQKNGRKSPGDLCARHLLILVGNSLLWISLPIPGLAQHPHSRPPPRTSSPPRSLQGGGWARRDFKDFQAKN